MGRWACVAILAAGCGHAAPPAPEAPPRHASTIDAGVALDTTPPKPLDEDLPRLAERAVGLFKAWSKALTDAGDDCATATKLINAVADANADVIAANAKISHAGRDKVKALRAALEPHADELDAAGKAIQSSPVMQKCSGDPAFARAIDRIQGEP